MFVVQNNNIWYDPKPGKKYHSIIENEGVRVYYCVFVFFSLSLSVCVCVCVYIQLLMIIIR